MKNSNLIGLVILSGFFSAGHKEIERGILEMQTVNIYSNLTE